MKVSMKIGIHARRLYLSNNLIRLFKLICKDANINSNSQKSGNYSFSSCHGQLINIIIIAVRRITIIIMMRPAVALL